VFLGAVLDLDDRDAGCEDACAALERYVEAEVDGEDPAARFPGIAVHLTLCRACRTDHDGLLALINHDGRIGAPWRDRR
jgi:hypothetical protein